MRITSGEYCTLDRSDWDKLRAIGCDSGWYRAENATTGKTTIAVQSKHHRMPLVPLSRVILGASPRHRIQYSGGPFDLRRKSLTMLEAR